MPLDPAQVLAQNARAAARFAQKAGPDRVRKVLERAHADLTGRLREAVRGPGAGSFTHAQLRSTLAQVKHTLRSVAVPGIQDSVLDVGDDAAEAAGGGVVEYMQAADDAYGGAGAQPLALDEASVLDAASDGAGGSVLRRLAGEGGVPGEGIMARYGMNVVGSFESSLQQSLVARASWDSVRAGLVDASPFLRGAPAHWAERIARTEIMGAHARATYEATREADDQLGDVVKILSATFDDRTAADSFAVHGQIRRPEEAFETWYGEMQYPPARPNDREIVVTHRVAWAIPANLRQLDNGAVAARWAAEGGKGKGRKMPPRPLMTTVDLDSFGKG